MIRRLTFIAMVVGLVVVGLVAQASAYLLAPPGPAHGGGSATTDASSLAEPGPHPVGVRTVTADEAPMPFTLWYPTEGPDEVHDLTYSYGINMLGAESSVALATFTGHATPGVPADTSGGPYPFVIMSHGFAITPSSYAWLAEHLASHGFVVAAPSHGESLDPRGLWRATVDRPADVVELLAHLGHEVRAGGEFAGLIDIESVAVVGHSYGGYTALAAAGARLDMDGFRDICEHETSSGDPLEFQCDALVDHVDDMAALAGLDATPSDLWPTAGDDRIDAVVSVAGDAAMFGTSGLAEISVPVLTIGGTADTDSPLEWGNRLAYEHVSSARKAEVVLNGADHMVFAGGCEQMRRIEVAGVSRFLHESRLGPQRGPRRRQPLCGGVLARRIESGSPCRRGARARPPEHAADHLSIGWILTCPTFSTHHASSKGAPPCRQSHSSEPVRPTF